MAKVYSQSCLLYYSTMSLGREFVEFCNQNVFSQLYYGHTFPILNHCCCWLAQKHSLSCIYLCLDTWPAAILLYLSIQKRKSVWVVKKKDLHCHKVKEVL